jgi:hypothetical protein
MVDNDTIWQEYPYMYGIPKSEIGDEEGAEATDDGISMERLAEAILAAEQAEEVQGNDSVVEEEMEMEEETVCNNIHDDVSVVSDDETIDS